MFQPTHIHGVTPVKVTKWARDGDHPLVERYPIERRSFKGLLVVSEKEKYGLRFGEYIVEDEQGRIYVISSTTLPDEYKPIEDGGVSGTVVAAIVAVGFVISLLVGGPQFNDFALMLIGVTHLMYYSSLLGQWNGLANGVFDLDTDTVKVSAHTNTYTPNQDTHDFFDDVTNEVTGTNYTAGGESLASKTVSRSTGTVTFDAADVVWLQSGAGFSNARKFVIYRSTGSAATSRLFSVVTADNDVGNVTGDLTLAWHTNGIATWSTT